MEPVSRQNGPVPGCAGYGAAGRAAHGPPAGGTAAQNDTTTFAEQVVVPASHTR